MKNPQFLFHTWFNLECIGVDGQMRLHPVPGSTCDDIEYVVGVKLLGETSISYQVYFRSDLPPSTVREIQDRIRVDVLGGEEDVWSILERSGFPKNELRREISYTFDQVPLVPGLVVEGAELEGETFCKIIDGRVVSRAWSIRSNEVAEEVAVETNGEFRRRGYGKQVVAQWVKRTLDRKKIPIYSHRKGNFESAALARSIGAIPFVEVVSYH